MITRTVTVKSAEFTDTADKKKQYLAAVLVNEDGKQNKQAIFDPKLQKVIQDALKSKATLSVKLEKEGNFWNLKEAEPLGESVQVATSPQKPSYGKSHEEQESIMRQSARRDAVEIYKHCVEAGVPFDRTQFEEYFGIMLRVGDPIVSEAVKLGGRTKDK